MKRILFTIVLAIAPFSLISSAPAATTHPTYALKHAKTCHVGYVKKTERHVVRVRVKTKHGWRVERRSRRYVACVWRVTTVPAPVVTTTVPAPAPVPSTTPSPTPTFTYKAHTDPSFVQSASNPMAVTYTYTADATKTVNGVVTDLAATGQLPAGILDLYSGGSLACSVNVGGSTTGSKCGVTYLAYGSHTVVTEYIPNGVTAVTETDTEDIEPFATTTSVATALIGPVVDVGNWYYQTVSVPVTVSGLTNSLGTTGAVSLTNTDAINESCQSLTYSASLGSASATCTAQIKNDPAVAGTWTPQVTFSGDTNYSSSGATGAAVTIPVAPAPTTTDVAVEVQCAESGGFCTEYNSAAETTDARANVYAGPIYSDMSPQVGTITFTSADHLTICSALVYSAAGIASNNGRCVGVGGQFEGPITVTYSGASIETGDTLVTNYQSAMATGGSN